MRVVGCCRSSLNSCWHTVSNCNPLKEEEGLQSVYIQIIVNCGGQKSFVQQTYQMLSAFVIMWLAAYYDPIITAEARIYGCRQPSPIRHCKVGYRPDDRGSIPCKSRELLRICGPQIKIGRSMWCSPRLGTKTSQKALFTYDTSLCHGKACECTSVISTAKARRSRNSRITGGDVVGTVCTAVRNISAVVP